MESTRSTSCNDNTTIDEDQGETSISGGNINNTTNGDVINYITNYWYAHDADVGELQAEKSPRSHHESFIFDTETSSERRRLNNGLPSGSFFEHADDTHTPKPANGFKGSQPQHQSKKRKSSQLPPARKIRILDQDTGSQTHNEITAVPAVLQKPYIVKRVDNALYAYRKYQGLLLALDHQHSDDAVAKTHHDDALAASTHFQMLSLSLFQLLDKVWSGNGASN